MVMLRWDQPANIGVAAVPAGKQVTFNRLVTIPRPVRFMDVLRTSHRFGVRAEQLLRAWATPFRIAAIPPPDRAGPPTQEPLQPRRFGAGDHAPRNNLRRASAARRFITSQSSGRELRAARRGTLVSSVEWQRLHRRDLARPVSALASTQLFINQLS